MKESAKKPTIDLKRLIRAIPDYPKRGIMFRDITTLLLDPQGLRAAVDGLLLPFVNMPIDLVAGIEARGFILGGAIAHELGKGFVPVRKKGKLPSETYQESYALEYGEATIEVHIDAFPAGARVLIVDDVLATGGTAAATAELVRRAGGQVVGLSVLLELSFLNGRRRVPDVSVHALRSV